MPLPNNPAAFTAASGIYIFDNDNHVESNTVTANGCAAYISVFATCTNNVIINNLVSGNLTNDYIVPKGNQLKPVANEAGAGNVWSNTSKLE